MGMVLASVGHVGVGEHRRHAVEAQGRRGVNAANSRMGVRAAQDGGVQHLFG